MHADFVLQTVSSLGQTGEFGIKRFDTSQVTYQETENKWQHFWAVASAA